MNNTNGSFIEDVAYTPVEGISTDKPFIESGSTAFTYDEVKTKHMVPVYTKDSQKLISHSNFIDTTRQAISTTFPLEEIRPVNLRLSHEIKGRSPLAPDHVKWEDLPDHLRTSYYQRMAFIFELPGITHDIAGNEFALTVGGVKAYNLDNLNGKLGYEQRFKVFIGFKNKVCSNLCVSSDGLLGDLKVRSQDELLEKVSELFSAYRSEHLEQHIELMSSFQDYRLTESQFALLLGKSKIYTHLPTAVKKQYEPFMFNETQINAICRDYYHDESFCRDENGSIDLWRVYNLFTGVNKKTNMEDFLDKNADALTFTAKIQSALRGDINSWYLR